MISKACSTISTSTAESLAPPSSSATKSWSSCSMPSVICRCRAADLPAIDKVLFVVDRKDLDYQTMREYERFEKGAANSNTSTAGLTRQLADPKPRVNNTKPERPRVG